jgi:hypothetical protein
MGPIDSQLRYLVHFDDGGSGMHHRDEPLRPGDELRDGGVDYVVEHARAERDRVRASLGRAGQRRVSRFRRL